jgi:uncharacterized protein YjiS (DUF1127 family)
LIEAITLIRFHDMGRAPIMSTGETSQEASMSDRSIHFAHFAPSGALRALVVEGWARFVVMLRARRTRQILGEMDDRMLADIGVGRGDAVVEAGRPMWDVEARRF